MSPEIPRVPREGPGPSARWRLAAGLGWGLAVLFGLAAGLGAYTFYYAEGASYFSDDPASCANCHVMRPQLDALVKSSHHAVAVCNDCHAPHGNLAAKLWVKGVNGFRHSWAFTTGDFHEPIQITDMNRRVTEAACRYCHAGLMHAIDSDAAGREAVACIRCHGQVGHD